MTEQNPSQNQNSSDQNTPPWFADDQKDYVTNKGWKTPADAVTSSINLEKLLGADRAGRTIVMPKDDKDVDGIKVFRAKLGVPEKVDDYQLPFSQGDSGDFAKTAAAWFHAAGVPKGPAQAIAAEWNKHFEGMVKEETERAKAESDRQLGELKTKWGNDFDKNSETARRFLRASGWDEQKIGLYEQTFGTASMLTDFFTLGSKLGEHEFASGGGGGGFSMSPQAAQQAINELRTKRIANQISEKDFHAEMQRLGPLAEKAA